MWARAVAVGIGVAACGGASGGPADAQPPDAQLADAALAGWTTTASGQTLGEGAGDLWDVAALDGTSVGLSVLDDASALIAVFADPGIAWSRRIRAADDAVLSLTLASSGGHLVAATSHTGGILVEHAGGEDAIGPLAGRTVYGVEYDGVGDVRWARAVASFTSATSTVPDVAAEGTQRTIRWGLGATARAIVLDDAGVETAAIARGWPAGGGLPALLPLGDATLILSVRGGELTRLDGDGGVIWTRTLDSVGVAELSHVVPLSGGDWLAVGTFAGTTTFGPGEPNATELTADGGVVCCPLGGPGCVCVRYPFFARYTSDGELAWVRRPIGVNGEKIDVLGVAAAGDDAIEVLGSTVGAATLEAGLSTERTRFTEIRALYTARIDGDGGLHDEALLGEIGRLSPIAADEADGTWWVGLDRFHGVGAGCWNELALDDGALSATPGTDGDETLPGWYVGGFGR